MSKSYYYDQHLSPEWTLFGYPGQVKKVTDFLRAYQPVLDLGCGNMLLSDYLDSVIGVDISPYVIEKNLSKGKECLLMFADNLNFPAKTFKSITAFDLFEHLSNEQLENTMKGISRVSAPGARLVIKAASFDDPDLFWSDYTHVRPFTKYSLELLLKNFEWNVLEIKPFFMKKTLESYIAFAEKQSV